MSDCITESSVEDLLTLSFLQTKTDTFANSADPDETAHTELYHLDLHCLPFCFFIFDRHPHLQQWMCPNSEMEESIS